MPRPPPTRRRLDEEREADLLGRAVGQDGNAGLAGDSLGGELVPAEAKRLRRRADPGQPGRVDRCGKVRVFGEEAVAGMDGVGPALPRGADVLLGVQVRGDLDELVAGARVERISVVGRNHGHRPDPELMACSKDAERDLAPVRNEQFSDGHRAVVCPHA